MSYRPITDVWILARCKYLGGVKRYGGYLGGFPERARALLGVTIEQPVLHVCGGMADHYPYRGGYGPNDARLDLDPAVNAEFVQSCMAPFPPGFAAYLADPPYSPEDAEKYDPGATLYPSPAALMQHMIDQLYPGQRAGMIHYMIPKMPKRAKFIAMVGVACGFNNRMRVYSVFERT